LHITSVKRQRFALLGKHSPFFVVCQQTGCSCGRGFKKGYAKAKFRSDASSKLAHAALNLRKFVSIRL